LLFVYLLFVYLFICLFGYMNGNWPAGNTTVGK